MKTFLILLFVVFAMLFIWASAFTGGFVAYIFVGDNTLAIVIAAVIGSMCACAQVNSIVNDILR